MIAAEGSNNELKTTSCHLFWWCRLFWCLLSWRLHHHIRQLRLRNKHKEIGLIAFSWKNPFDGRIPKQLKIDVGKPVWSIPTWNGRPLREKIFPENISRANGSRISVRSIFWWTIRKQIRLLAWWRGFGINLVDRSALFFQLFEFLFPSIEAITKGANDDSMPNLQPNFPTEC